MKRESKKRPCTVRHPAINDDHTGCIFVDRYTESILSHWIVLDWIVLNELVSLMNRIVTTNRDVNRMLVKMNGYSPSQFDRSSGCLCASCRLKEASVPTTLKEILHISGRRCVQMKTKTRVKTFNTWTTFSASTANYRPPPERHGTANEHWNELQ